jgi:protein SCO1/2
MFKTTLTIALSLWLGGSVFYEQPALKKLNTNIDWARPSHRDAEKTAIVIRDGWVQEGPSSQKITAAYMVIENHSQTDVTLKSASTSSAEVIELHKMELIDGLMKMRKVDSINIPAGSEVELKPGGYHLMVIGLKQSLKEGDMVSISLEFSGDLRQSITVPVKPRSAMVKEGSDFTLTDENGRQFRLSQLHGKVVLLFFGYTHCPDACPTTMTKLARAAKLLGNDADRVVTLFVSVDPGRDTPDVLKHYLEYFHLNSVGLTGTKDEIDAVVKQYGARYEIEQSDSAAGYHVNHSTDLYLLDQKGELVKTFGYNDATQTVVDGVRPLLK